MIPHHEQLQLPQAVPVTAHIARITKEEKCWSSVRIVVPWFALIFRSHTSIQSLEHQTHAFERQGQDEDKHSEKHLDYLCHCP